MADQIPGRRLSHGDSFYTNWFSRGGDSMLLRAESIVASGGSVTVSVETRAEPGDSPSTVPSTYLSNGTTPNLTLNAAGIFTGYWRATENGTDSLKAQVRLKVSFSGGSAGNYHVIRMFSPIFFDNAKP